MNEFKQDIAELRRELAAIRKDIDRLLAMIGGEV
jgi:hypothetical protein